MPLEIDWKARQCNQDVDFRAFTEHFTRVHFDWNIKQSDGPNRAINAHIKKYQFDQCFVTDIRTLPISGERSFSTASTKQPCYLVIAYILEGRGYGISIGAHHTFVNRGSLFVWNSHQPMRFESTENIRQISIFIPASFHGNAQSLFAADKVLVLDNNNVLSNILRSNLMTLRKNAHRMHSGEERPIINALLSLTKAATALESTGQSARNRNAASLMQEAREYIDENLFDSDIGVQSLSRALGVSSRYVQKLFAKTGVSLTRTISDKRLNEAARYLSDSGLRELSITDIAFMIGFNDAAYFSKVFRTKYGISPKQYRLEHLQVGSIPSDRSTTELRRSPFPAPNTGWIKS